jgi:serine/threonine protein kinase
VGTPGFQSPESRQDRYSTKADVFSLGCAFFTMLTGQVRVGSAHRTTAPQSLGL